MSYFWTLVFFILKSAECNPIDCIDFVTSSNVKYGSRDLKVIKLKDKRQGSVVPMNE